MDGLSDAVNYCSMFRRWLCDESDKRDAPLNLVALGWRDTCAECPKQTNGYDCGVYVIKGIEQLAKGLALEHSEQDITNFRVAITNAILFDKLDSRQPNLNTVFLLDEEVSEPEDGLELLFKIGDFDPDEDGIGEASCNDQAPKVEVNRPEEQVTGVEGMTSDDKADCKVRPGPTVLKGEWMSSDDEEEFPSWNHNEQPGFMSKYRVDSYNPPATKHQKAQRNITFIHSKQPDVFAEPFLYPILHHRHDP